MKIKKDSNLKIKYFLHSTDNLNYSGNEFIPPYSYYIEFVKKSFLNKNYKGNEKIEVLVIAIELAGKIKNLRAAINYDYKVRITGIKELFKSDNIDDYESNIEENKFRIEFKIDLDGKLLKSNIPIKNTHKDGIIKLYYEIKQKEKFDNEIKIIQKEKKEVKNKEKKKKNSEKKEKNKK